MVGEAGTRVVARAGVGLIVDTKGCPGLLVGELASW